MKFVTYTISMLVLLPVYLFGQINWIEHDVNNAYGGPSSVISAYIDNDNLLDIVATSIGANKITWWKNLGGTPPSWAEYDIDYFLGAAFTWPIDLDQDNDVDIAGAAWYGNEIAWWENQGGTPVNWLKHSIDAAFPHAHEVFATDMDNDGDIDVLGASAQYNEIAWWRNDGNTPIVWTKFVIDSMFTGARSARAAYINDDSLIDVVGAALLAHDVAIYYMVDDSTWSKDTVDPAFYGAHMVCLEDIDSDNDIDIVACAYQVHDIAWYRNDGGVVIQWHKQVIDGNFLSALGVYAKDVNDDGHVDVLGGADAADQIACWYNDGQDPVTWTKQVIAYNFNGAWPVHAGDIDNDNDIDVLGGAYTDNDVTWWEHTATGIKEQHAWNIERMNLTTTVVSGPLPVPDGTDHTIYDIYGRKIRNLDPPAGIYFIHSNERTVRKLVKVN